MTLYP